MLKIMELTEICVNFAGCFLNKPQILSHIYIIIVHYRNIMNGMKRIWLWVMLTGISTVYATAEIPAGYYDSCEGKTGEALLKALHARISSHTNVGYDGLWDVYKSSDVRADGTLWDIYTTKAWSPNFKKCGNYSVIGDCVNREHSMPKSVWGGSKSTQYSDAFHLYPTDGKVNGQRSSFPYGECANGTRLPNNGSVQALGRLGNSTFSGYSGKVFEPDDQYKGDLARSYFYMAACYNNLIGGWTKGEMANMMGGNSYPVFKSWAVNLLLKWARQDEVSQKEIDRNDAIYEHQKNRNPFIDHPELVEYIWGDKVGQAWYASSAALQPDILQPVQNVTVDMGIAAVDLSTEATIYVKTKGVEGTVTFSIYDSGKAMSLSTYAISAEQANAGYSLKVICRSSVAGKVAGTLSISADDMEREVDVVCTVVDGLPVYDATDVSSDEFTVRWVNVGDAPTYTLDVKQGMQSIAGYPCRVTASDETYKVTGLEPLTTYTFQLSSTTICSEIKSVTTADLLPNIDVMFDGVLHFDAAPGTPSDVAELLLEIENVSDDIIITVDAPFEISTDKSAWGTSVTLDPEEDRFYMRLNGQTEGSFETTILIKAGSNIWDDASASGTIVDPAAVNFLETFNVATSDATAPYKSGVEFDGTACRWKLGNAGLAKGEGVDGTNGIRFGKESTSTLTMMADKQSGLGTVTFYAANWTDTEGVVTVSVESSGDGGLSWTPAGSVTFSSGTFDKKTVTVNRSGNARIRFCQTSGARWLIDNISISNYNSMSELEQLDYHSWDAYCRDGRLVIECRDNDKTVAVYGVDGLTWVDNVSYPAGEHAIDLPKGLYIVVSDDFVRRVLVK